MKQVRKAGILVMLLGTLLWTGGARAQDLSGSTPCCACSGGSQCGALVSQEGLSTLSGCVGLDNGFPPTCAGGEFVDARDMKLIDGCLCVLGSCFDAQGNSLSAADCAKAAVAACRQSGNATTCAAPGPGSGCSEDKDCPHGQKCRDGMCVPAGCQNDADCDHGERCEMGTCGPRMACSTSADCPEDQTCFNGMCAPCLNHSGGGDQTNPGGGGNPLGCDNPGGTKHASGKSH